MKTLTYKQKKFAEFYDGNATSAARKAGYKGSTEVLSQIGYENLRKPEVKEAIHERGNREMSEIICNRQKRQEFWSKLMTDEGIDLRFRLKASELLGRSEGDFLNNIEAPNKKTLEDLILESMKIDSSVNIKKVP